MLLQVMNAFSLQSDAEMKGKVIARLCNMTELHQLLNKSLAGNVYNMVRQTVAHEQHQCIVTSRRRLCELRQQTAHELSFLLFTDILPAYCFKNLDIKYNFAMPSNDTYLTELWLDIGTVKWILFHGVVESRFDIMQVG